MAGPGQQRGPVVATGVERKKVVVRQGGATECGGHAAQAAALKAVLTSKLGEKGFVPLGDDKFTLPNVGGISGAACRIAIDKVDARGCGEEGLIYPKVAVMVPLHESAVKEIVAAQAEHDVQPESLLGGLTIVLRETPQRARAGMGGFVDGVVQTAAQIAQDVLNAAKLAAGPIRTARFGNLHLSAAGVERFAMRPPASSQPEEAGTAGEGTDDAAATAPKRTSQIAGIAEPLVIPGLTNES